MSTPTFLIVGTGNPEFGTGVNVGYTAIGTIVSADRDDDAEKLEIKDRNGNVVVAIYFNYKNECTIEVIFDTTITLPTIGSALSVCGLINVLVDKITHKWSNEKERMVSIKATRYSQMTGS